MRCCFVRVFPFRFACFNSCNLQFTSWSCPASVRALITALKQCVLGRRRRSIMRDSSCSAWCKKQGKDPKDRIHTIDGHAHIQSKAKQSKELLSTNKTVKHQCISYVLYYSKQVESTVSIKHSTNLNFGGVEQLPQYSRDIIFIIYLPRSQHNIISLLVGFFSYWNLWWQIICHIGHEFFSSLGNHNRGIMIPASLQKSSSSPPPKKKTSKPIEPKLQKNNKQKMFILIPCSALLQHNKPW